MLRALELPGKRRGWDSNPRTTCAVNGFQDRPVRPLRHPAERKSVAVVGIRESRAETRARALSGSEPQASELRHGVAGWRRAPRARPIASIATRSVSVEAGNG